MVAGALGGPSCFQVREKENKSERKRTEPRIFRNCSPSSRPSTLAAGGPPPPWGHSCERSEPGDPRRTVGELPARKSPGLAGRAQSASQVKAASPTGSAGCKNPRPSRPSPALPVTTPASPPLGAGRAQRPPHFPSGSHRGPHTWGTSLHVRLQEQSSREYRKLDDLKPMEQSWRRPLVVVSLAWHRHGRRPGSGDQPAGHDP